MNQEVEVSEVDAIVAAAVAKYGEPEAKRRMQELQERWDAEAIAKSVAVAEGNITARTAAAIAVASHVAGLHTLIAALNAADARLSAYAFSPANMEKLSHVLVGTCAAALAGLEQFKDEIQSANDALLLELRRG
jgi:ethanolamine utilization microcompartment shell protein EutL